MSCTSAELTRSLPSSYRSKRLAATDARGVLVTPTDPRALELFEKALAQYQSYLGDPFATIDEALAVDPRFVVGHVFRAMVLATLTERRFIERARVSVASAEALLPQANAREKRLTAAARRLVDGEWDEACRHLDTLLVEHPRDALAIQTAHLMDFYRGDALNLKQRIVRVLPHWSANVPGYSYILGMYAFGLEECNQYAEAEDIARRALDLEPKDAWAVHAGAHVFEMTGRVDEGAAWLASRERDWAPDNGLAFHNYWHMALFLLDHERYAEALAVYDRHIHESPPDSVLQLLDATALLFRLHLEGVEIGARAVALARNWASRLDVERGFYVFNDVHAMMAFTMAGWEKESTRLLADLEWTVKNGSGSNRRMTREVGLPIARAIRAFGRQRYDETIVLLRPVRDLASRFGGSHAQRDVLTLTLIEAAIRNGRSSLARHYIAERTFVRPTSQLGTRLAARAQEMDREPTPTTLRDATPETDGLEVRRVALSGRCELEYADRGEGPAVLLLHGLTDSWRSFE
ncbi:MAG TPA: tetratricopeptide repeat protein, partial [Labilithrix sp.]|nr:tetratricopeptide repeat protein [Labilithrix sp.]